MESKIEELEAIVTSNVEDIEKVTADVVNNTANIVYLKDIAKFNVLSAQDCYEIFMMNYSLPGVFHLNSIGTVKCLESGWTSIQERGQFENPGGFFSKNWAEYKEFFGSLGSNYYS